MRSRQTEKQIESASAEGLNKSAGNSSSSGLEFVNFEN